LELKLIWRVSKLFEINTNIIRNKSCSFTLQREIRVVKFQHPIQPIDCLFSLFNAQDILMKLIHMLFIKENVRHVFRLVFVYQNQFIPWWSCFNMPLATRILMHWLEILSCNFFFYSNPKYNKWRAYNKKKLSFTSLCIH